MSGLNVALACPAAKQLLVEAQGWVERDRRPDLTPVAWASLGRLGIPVEDMPEVETSRVWQGALEHALEMIDALPPSTREMFPIAGAHLQAGELLDLSWHALTLQVPAHESCYLLLGSSALRDALYTLAKTSLLHSGDGPIGTGVSRKCHPAGVGQPDVVEYREAMELAVRVLRAQTYRLRPDQGWVRNVNLVLPLDDLAKALTVTLVAERFLMLHELAHVAKGHVEQRPRSDAENVRRELECDALAAYVLLGAQASEAHRGVAGDLTMSGIIAGIDLTLSAQILLEEAQWWRRDASHPTGNERRTALMSFVDEVLPQGRPGYSDLLAPTSTSPFEIARQITSMEHVAPYSTRLGARLVHRSDIFEFSPEDQGNRLQRRLDWYDEGEDFERGMRLPAALHYARIAGVLFPLALLEAAAAELRGSPLWLTEEEYEQSTRSTDQGLYGDNPDYGFFADLRTREVVGQLAFRHKIFPLIEAGLSRADGQGVVLFGAAVLAELGERFGDEAVAPIIALSYHWRDQRASLYSLPETVDRNIRAILGIDPDAPAPTLREIESAFAGRRVGESYDRALRRMEEGVRRLEAITPRLNDANLLRGLTQQDAGYGPELGKMLRSLAIRLAEVGRLTDAAEHARQSADAYRDVVRAESGYLPQLAEALDHLALRYAELDRHGDAVPPAEEAVDNYRALAGDDAEMRCSLGRALNDLGGRYAAVGRLQEAIAKASESVAVLRSVVAEHPGRSPWLASALASLGSLRGQLGNPVEGVAELDEAMLLYRDLTAANRAYRADLAATSSVASARLSSVPGRQDDAASYARQAIALWQEIIKTEPQLLSELATTLRGFSELCERDGRPEAGREAWAAALRSAPPRAVGPLLSWRVSMASDDDEEAAGWIADALESVEDPARVARLRDEARRRRSVNPSRFDREWRAHSGSLPSWLSVDRHLVDEAGAWLASRTPEEGRDFLATHPHLLLPGADDAVAEVLAQIPFAAAKILDSVRRIARQEGLEEAYRPLIAAKVAERFLRSTPGEQARMLAERSDELLSEEVLDRVNEFVRQHDERFASRIRSVIALTTFGVDLAVEALETLEQVELRPAWMARLAEIAKVHPSIYIFASGIIDSTPSREGYDDGESSGGLPTAD